MEKKLDFNSKKNYVISMISLSSWVVTNTFNYYQKAKRDQKEKKKIELVLAKSIISKKMNKVESMCSMVKFALPNKSNFNLYILLFIFIFSFGTISNLFSADSLNESYKTLPVSYKGRFVPLDVYARLELQEFYGKLQIKKEHQAAFNLSDRSALTYLLSHYFYGHEQFDDSPLFSIHYAESKKLLGLNLKENHFSYHLLSKAIYENEESNLRLMSLLIPYFFIKNIQDTSNRTTSSKQEIKQLTPGLFATLNGDKLIIAKTPNSAPWNFLKTGFVLTDNFNENLEIIGKSRLIVDELLNLLSLINTYKSSNGMGNADNLAFENSFKELQEKQIAPKEIAVLLETQHPLIKRLHNSGSLLKVLPLKRSAGFVSLHALALKTYDSKTASLNSVGNFTNYSDNEFEAIKKTYFEIEASVKEKNESLTFIKFKELANALNESYNSLAGTPSKEAFQKKIDYPTKKQLQAELAYYQYSFLEITIFLYAVALIGLILSVTLKKNLVTACSITIATVGFMLHTFILALRCYILKRPPVSNMFETVIYVPWIAMIAGFIFYIRFKNPILLIASCFSALSLLILLEVTGMNNSLENVQAVLDSQYWLIIHVMAIVGSYGIFFLSGILSQIYLIQYLIRGKETAEMKFLTNFILQTMYVGVLLLIPGTILGGVWAAESWGRFWDWDPKESWAFISACIYLIVIHAYRFHKITSFGLSLGSVIGLLAISFTWYGVNYILGTGLHSYGFGSGGEIYYYVFILSELTFLTIVSYKHKNIIEMKSKNMI